MLFRKKKNFFVLNISIKKIIEIKKWKILIIKDPLSSAIGKIDTKIYNVVGKKLFFVTIDTFFNQKEIINFLNKLFIY